MLVGYLMFGRVHLLLARAGGNPSAHASLPISQAHHASLPRIAMLWAVVRATGPHGPPRARAQDYAGVALLSVIAVYLTNVSLHTVPYTLKIVVKSCRVLPVMALSAAYQGKVYTTQQVVSACAMVAGVGLFFAGDWREAPHAQGEWTGVALLLAALVMDAVVANLEEGRFFRSVTPASRVEVMTYLSAFGALYSLVTLALSGAWLPLECDVCVCGALQSGAVACLACRRIVTPC